MSEATGGATPIDQHVPAKAACPKCHGPMSHDPHLIGQTVGGLTRCGWDWCPDCEQYWLSSQGKEQEQWRLAKGGLSVETGALRIRIEGSDSEAKRDLVLRILRLPELERFERMVKS